MHVIRARNVCEAYVSGLSYLRAEGKLERTRAGDALVSPVPVATVYERPWERVLLDPRRDANPFFHLFESLWLLAGRDDARWLDRFVGDFSSRFAQPDGRLHGSYGRRWRSHFPRNFCNPSSADAATSSLDQLDEVVRLLRNNPADRQAVLTMWDPAADLGVPGLHDRPCNTHVYLRMREEPSGVPPVEGAPFFNSIAALPRRVLDITVCCRSNDAVWGAYGANAVQFSVLQEYLAGRVGVAVGNYYQISHNFHVYVDALERIERARVRTMEDSDLAAMQNPYDAWTERPVCQECGGRPWRTDEPRCERCDGSGHLGERRRVAEAVPMGTDWASWDADLRTFMAWTENGRVVKPWNNRWFRDTAVPLWLAHSSWRAGDREDALSYLTETDSIAPDWRAAALVWMRRRKER